MSVSKIDQFRDSANLADDESDLPEGWSLAPIGTVCQINPPKPPKDYLPADALVSFVPMAAVDATSGTIVAPVDRPYAEVRGGFTAFREGDVIFAKITPCMENGKAAVARALTNSLGFGSSEFHVLRPSEAVLPEYLFYFIRQESFRKIAEENMSGSVGQLRVPAAFVANSPIPIPPLAEQRRIVAQIDALLVPETRVRTTLARAASIVKRFRQSVLAAACSGRLTEDWRDSRGAEWLKGELAQPGWSQLSLEDGADIQNPFDPGLPQLPGLPDEWMLIPLGKIAELLQYGTSVKASSDPSCGIPILRMGNIQGGRIDLSNLKYVDPLVADVSRCIAKRGDILFNRTNSPDLVGKSAVFDVDRHVAFASYLVRLRCTARVALSQFVCYWINSSWGRLWASVVKTDGVSQSNINATKLASMPLPLPSLSEQREIVRRVEDLLTLADVIEGRLENATAQVEKLSQSILAKAFRGELVPTEAELAQREGREYEPAWTMLERIRASQADRTTYERRPRVVRATCLQPPLLVD